MDSLVGLPGPHSRARSTPPALPGKVLTVDLSSAPAINESRILLRGSSPSDDLPLKKNQARIFFFFLLENERRKRWDTEEWNVDSVWQLRVFKDKQYCRIRSSAWTVQYVSRFFCPFFPLCKVPKAFFDVPTRPTGKVRRIYVLPDRFGTPRKLGARFPSTRTRLVLKGNEARRF